MTLQQPHLSEKRSKDRIPILCHKCGSPIEFNKNHVGPNGRKIPLDPFFNNEPHEKHCIYFTSPSKTDTELMLFDFLSLIPNKRQRRIIGAVGRAK